MNNSAIIHGQDHRFEREKRRRKQMRCGHSWEEGSHAVLIIYIMVGHEQEWGFYPSLAGPGLGEDDAEAKDVPDVAVGEGIPGIGGRPSEYCGGSSMTLCESSAMSLCRMKREERPDARRWPGLEVAFSLDIETGRVDGASEVATEGLREWAGAGGGGIGGRMNGVALYWPGGRKPDGGASSFMRSKDSFC